MIMMIANNRSLLWSSLWLKGSGKSISFKETAEVQWWNFHFTFVGKVVVNIMVLCFISVVKMARPMTMSETSSNHWNLTALSFRRLRHGMILNYIKMAAWHSWIPFCYSTPLPICLKSGPILVNIWVFETYLAFGWKTFLWSENTVGIHYNWCESRQNYSHSSASKSTPPT